MAAWLARGRAGFCSRAFVRSLCTLEASDKTLHTCIIGSGPAGFYVAGELLKRLDCARVDILDRLPTPFGLVRSGVAPDHPETKNVINKFSHIAEDERCKFYGNVRLGQDVSLEELRKIYHIVVVAYGAESDAKLGIPGENLKGVLSAREFVWWYNGHPDGKDLPIDVHNTESAVVLGQGNVALDVARILLRPVDELSKTDITEHALKVLQESWIRKVYVVGRRGPVQAACTAGELREVLGMRGVDVIVQRSDILTSSFDEEEMRTSRSHRRVYDLFYRTAHRSPKENEKQLHFVFFRAPVSILPSEDSEHVKGVRFEKTKLEGSSPQRTVGTGEFEEIACGLVLRSIGYKPLPVSGLPFDDKRGIVPNLYGRVLNNDKPEDGLYVAGWLKRGAIGVISTNKICAEEVVASIQEDWKAGKSIKPKAEGSAGLELLLKERGKRYVSFDDWERLNQVEIEKGASKGKPREKIVPIDEALEVALGTK